MQPTLPDQHRVPFPLLPPPPRQLTHALQPRAALVLDCVEHVVEVVQACGCELCDCMVVLGRHHDRGQQRHEREDVDAAGLARDDEEDRHEKEHKHRLPAVADKLKLHDLQGVGKF
eukprot:11217-Chlamydomonas_euryale.AAC.2